MAYQDITFLSHGISLNGRCFYDGENRPGLLFIPGAKPGPFATSDEFNIWREKLDELGINSFVFDGPGFGKSDVDPDGSSLAKRIIDAQAAYDTFLKVSKSDPTRIAVLGSSMGGHVLTRLVEAHQKISCVILDRAAAYSEAAESIVFGPDFSAELRRTDSWKESPAFPILERYAGRVLVVYGDQEEVVPAEIQQAFIRAVGERGQVVTIYGGSHFFLRDDSPEGKVRKQPFFDEITKFLSRELLG